MMKILSKIDRFGLVPQLNFRGHPFASTFVGSILSICLILLLALVFSVFVALSIDKPSTTSFISPMSFTDELDLIPAELKFCVALKDYSKSTSQTSYGTTEEALQKLFDEGTKHLFKVYILTEDNDRTDRGFKYCLDKSVSPAKYCVCLTDGSLKIQSSDTLYVKINFGTNFNTLFNLDDIDMSVDTTVTTLIPYEVSNPQVKRQKFLKAPDLLNPNYAYADTFNINFDKLVYKIDTNYFFSSPKTTYSLLPRSYTQVGIDEDITYYIGGWIINFSGQTLTSETKVTKILDILAQVGALNGVFVLVATILFGSFFKLKFSENLLNGLNKPPQMKRDYAKDNLLLVESLERSSEPSQVLENTSKKHLEDIVRQKYLRKKPLYIGFWEWLGSCFKNSPKVKALEGHEQAIKQHFDIAKVIRNNMEFEVIKRVLFSPNQLYMLENMPFDSPELSQYRNKVSPTSSSKSFELLRNKESQYNIESRFIEIMKKTYN